MNDVKRVIVRAREILSDPKHWIKSEYARNSDGSPVLSTSPAAVGWCSIGALWKADAETSGPSTRVQVYNLLQQSMLDGHGIAVFNDSPGTTHSDVMAAFDRAIESLED